MRRLARRLFALCSAVSLLLCVAVCVLWVRGYSRGFRTPTIQRLYLTSSDGWANLCQAAGTEGEVTRSVSIYFSPDGKVPRRYRLSTFDRFFPNETILRVPLWAVALGLAVAPVTAFAVRNPRRTAGHCANCGYDLRASPGRCPECGTPPRAEKGGPDGRVVRGGPGLA